MAILEVITVEIVGGMMIYMLQTRVLQNVGTYFVLSGFLIHPTSSRGHFFKGHSRTRYLGQVGSLLRGLAEVV